MMDLMTFVKRFRAADLDWGRPISGTFVYASNDEEIDEDARLTFLVGTLSAYAATLRHPQLSAQLEQLNVFRGEKLL